MCIRDRVLDVDIYNPESLEVRFNKCILYVSIVLQYTGQNLLSSEIIDEPLGMQVLMLLIATAASDDDGRLTQLKFSTLFENVNKTLQLNLLGTTY